MSIKTLLVAGARPNFMKIAPIYRASLKFPGDRLQDRPHRAALRPRYVADVLRRSGDSVTRLPSGSGVGKPRRADCQDHGCLRRGLRDRKTRCRHGRGRREFDPGVQRGSEEGVDQGRSRGGGFAELRSRHARRDQPHGDGCAIGLFFCHRRERHPKPLARGEAGR